MNFSLVVDDSSVIRKVARRIMEDLRFVSLEAESADGALGQCRANMPDVILLDWHLPGGEDTPDLIRRIRAEPDGDLPHIIFCTTENDTKTISGALSAGANAYLMKPYDREAIRSKLIEAGLTKSATQVVGE